MAISLQSTLPRTHRIASFEQVTPQAYLFTIEGTFGAKPGQFIMVWEPGLDEIPLSIADDDGEKVTIAFFVAGNCTEALSNKKVGDLVGLRGPFGTHYQTEGAKRIVVVAGGHGSAPMYFAAKTAMAHGARLDMIAGAKTADQLLFLPWLEKLTPASLTFTSDDGSRGDRGLVTAPLEALLSTEGKDIDCVFTCGPERMLVAVSKLCAEYGVPAQLSACRYFKCGYGLCGSCVVEPLGIRLCQEGPVLTNEVFRQITDFGVFTRDHLGRVEKI